jgi:hypothetical protein
MTGKQLSEIPVVFYRTSLGAEPVRDWLRGLPADDRRTIGLDLATVQVGWPWECRYVARSVPDYGKYAAVFRAAELREYCFSFMRGRL